MRNDIFGLIRPANDIHTLGISIVAQILEDCGYRVVIGDAILSNCLNNLSNLDNQSYLKAWIKENKINRIGFSYRLDPKDGQRLFGIFFNFLISERLFKDNSYEIKQVFFAGLPLTASLIEKEYNGKIITFIGDETPLETLEKLEVPKKYIKSDLLEGTKYDKFRMDFSKDFIDSEKYKYFKPIKDLSYLNLGTKKDTINERLYHRRKISNLPLIRAHVGPYNEDKKEAIKEFKHWLKDLKEANFLDIVSIGSSQLSQSHFNENWEGIQNGGGVPIQNIQDLNDIYEASRPMLIRTYSGTKNTQELANIYEDSINICWHALSFWWFNKIDGRGPHDVKTNLKNHLETLSIIAKYDKPFEPNIPHHFSFRGSDDITYVLSSYLACITAKKHGVKKVILQTMLNTPKQTWGIQDLAKSRALLSLVKELEDEHFKVYLQPRAGLDYFSPNLEKAKYQLASVSALIDDIEPYNEQSPDIIHVVSYSEAVSLATPEIINESIQITLSTIEEYRKFKKSNPDYLTNINNEVKPREFYLFDTVKKIRSIIEENISNPYNYEGLYEIFQRGILNAPYLWECREEFNKAVEFKTKIVNGSVTLIDKSGNEINIIEKVLNAF